MRDLVARASSPAHVIAVTSATSAATAWGLVTELRLDADNSRVSFLLDARRELYAALGLVRSVRATFTWHSWRNALGALAFPRQCCRGRVPTLNAGDPWQQGGVFVVARDGSILFAHRDEAPGWPKVDEPAFARALAQLAGERGAPGDPGGAPKQRGRRRGAALRIGASLVSQAQARE